MKLCRLCNGSVVPIPKPNKEKKQKPTGAALKPCH